MAEVLYGSGSPAFPRVLVVLVAAERWFGFGAAESPGF